MPFNLLTPYGRAQAYAHSAEGAELVRLLERTEELQLEALAETLDAPVHDIYNDTQYILCELQDTNYDAQLERFKAKLTLKQRTAFNRILRIRRKREEDLLNSLVSMQLQLENIKKICKIL